MEGGLREGPKRVMTEGMALVHSAHVLHRDRDRILSMKHIFTISEHRNVRSAAVIMVLKTETFFMKEIWC